MSEQVTFRSKRPGYKVVIEPADEILNHHGKVVEKIKGLRADFSPEGILTTDDPKLIEGLRASNGYNQVFWEDGRPPETPLPTVADQMSEITSAATEGDVGAIEKVIEVEQETHQRVEILSAAKAALATLAEE